MMSGQTMTPGCLPFAGCTKYASHVPSAVVIFTAERFAAVAAVSRMRAWAGLSPTPMMVCLLRWPLLVTAQVMVMFR